MKIQNVLRKLKSSLFFFKKIYKFNTDLMYYTCRPICPLTYLNDQSENTHLLKK